MVPVIEKINFKNIEKIIKLIKKACISLYCSNCPIDIKTEEIQKDLEIEFYEKVISRFNSIEGILDESVIKYKEDLFTLVRLSSNEIKKYFSTLSNYYFIHGDLNFSNILINEKETEIKFIDPRAYFGNTKLFGLAAYDLAKIAYALSGYDKFNSELTYLFLNDLCYTSPRSIRRYFFSH